MKRWILDTNIVSLLVRGNAVVLRNVTSKPMISQCISAVTAGELSYGLARRPEATQLRRAVEEFLLRVDVLPWDALVANRYGDLRANMEAKGKSLSALDMQIAAHAVERELTLVTNDQAFDHVPGLQLEDWLKNPA